MGVFGADSSLRQGPGSFQSCFHCPSKPLKAHWDPKAHVKQLTWKANSNGCEGDAAGRGWLQAREEV